jgi:hypothetical protein
MVEFSRTEYRTCAVFLMQDRDTQRVYRLYDFTNAQLVPPYQAYLTAGNVNSVDGLNLVIESVRPDTRHARCSNIPVHADGAGGSGIGESLRPARHRAIPRRPVRIRPAPMHSCVSRCRQATFPETKPAIVRVVYVGTNSRANTAD